MGRTVRVLIIAGIAGIAVAIAVAALRPWAARSIARRARTIVVDRATAAMGAPVTLDDTGFTFVPTVLVLEDLRLLNDGSFGLRAGSSVSRVELRGTPIALMKWGTRPVAIRVDRPILKLRFPPGAAGAPAAGPSSEGPPGGGAGDFPPGSSLTARNGEVEIEAPAGILFRCEGFGLDTRRAAEPSQLAGRLHCSRGHLNTPFGVLQDLEGQIGFEGTEERMVLDPVILHSTAIDLAGRGMVSGLQPGGRLPDIEGEGVLAVESAGLASWLPPEAAPVGRLETRLKGACRAGTVRAEGTLAAPALRLFGVDVTGLSADFRLDGALAARALKAQLLGGSIAGEVTLAPRPAGGYQAQAVMSAVDLDAERLLQLAGWTGPLLSGTLRYNGRHNIDTTGVDSLTGSGDLNLVGRLAGGGKVPLPIEASMRVETLGRILELSDGVVKARSVEAQFDGTLSQKDGLTLRLRGGTGNISDLLPLFALGSRTAAEPVLETITLARLFRSLRFRSGAPLAVLAAAAGPRAAPGRPGAEAAGSGLERLLKALGGRWRWDGTLRYDRQGLTFDGTLSGDDLTYAGVALGTVVAEVRYAGERLDIRRASLRPLPGSEAIFVGAVDFRGAGNLKLEGVLTQVPMAPLLKIAGLSWEVTGAATGRMDVTGTFAAPRWDAEFSSQDVEILGAVFDRLAGKAGQKDGVFATSGLTLTQGDGSLRLVGDIATSPPAVVPPGDVSRGLVVEGGGFDLERLRPWLRGAPITGRLAAIEGRLEGVLTAPTGRVALRADAVGIAGFAAGDVTLDGELSGGPMKVLGAAPARGLTLSGDVDLGNGATSDLILDIASLVLTGGELMEGVPEDVSLSLDGRVVLSGSLRDPSAMAATARFERVRLAAGAASATSAAGVQAVLQSGTVTLSPALLIGDGTRVDVRAVVDLDPQGKVDLESHGSFDLALLRTFVRGLHAEGRGDIELRVSGLRRDPAFRGALQLSAPRLRYPDLPFPIDSLEGRIAFDGVGAHIETLHFSAGGGEVVATGEVLLGKTGPSAGLASILAADLSFRGTGVSADFPHGFRSLSDPDLRFIFDPTGAELRGVVDLVRGVYSRDFRMESSLLTGREPAFFDRPGPLGPIGRMRLNLSLRGDDQIWLRNDFGRIEGQVDLRVTGTAEWPSVAGRVTALDGSTIDFNRVRYRLLSGTIDFNDPEVINPVFNLAAETSVAEYQVNLQVDGTIDAFRYELTSNPPLPQSDIVALLLTGRPIGGGGAPGALSPENVSAYLAGTLGQELSTRFFGKVAPDIIAIDPLEVVAQGDPTTRITLGKQITPDLRVTYTDLLGGSQGASYSLDYTIGRSIGFTSGRDSDGSIGGDFRYTLSGRTPDPPWTDVIESLAPQPRIGQVRLEGEYRLKESRILRRLRIRPGARRDRAKINDGVERLLATYRRKGYLTAEVDVSETPAADQTVDLTVQAKAGPRVTIDIEGTGDRRALREAIEPLWQQTIFIEDTAEAARDRIRSLIHDRGWRKATVKAEVLRSDADSVLLRFLVTPGPRMRAASIDVAGTKQIRSEEVRRVIRSRPDTLLRRGIVRGDRLREDAAAIQTLYVSRGFPRVNVALPEVIESDGMDHASVLFRIEEGPRVSVRTTRFEGAVTLSVERLVDQAGIVDGVPFTRENAELAAARVRRTFDDAGFPDARVQVRTDTVGEDAEAEEVDLVFTVEEGRRQLIGEVTIAGNRITGEKVIRKVLTVEPYDPLSRADLLASQTRLYRLGTFRAVELRAAPPPTVPAAETGAGAEPLPLPVTEDGIWLRPVQATVMEAAPIRQVFGLGFDTEAKVRGLYEIAHRNLFGSGRYAGLQLRGSAIERRASLLYREHGLFGGRYDLFGSAYGADEDRPAFSGTTVGIGAQLDRQVTPATRLRYRYSLKDVDLDEASVGFDGSTVRLASLAMSGVHDTRDSPFAPSRGHYYAGDLQGYGQALGSEADIGRVYLQAYNFRQIKPRLVWAQAVRVGAALPFGRTVDDPAATGDAVSGVPPTERFFAGGDTTLRGIERDLAGELDAEGKPFGGEGLFLLNEELRFAIWRSVHGVVFTDVGNVYRTLSDYTLRDLRYCIGAGLRLMTPIGPFRVEYGALLDRVEGEESGQLFFSIGQAF